MRLLALAAAFALTASLAQAAPQNFTWDGYGTAGGSKCPTYALHLELTADNGRVVGWWQQKGREVRKFDLPMAGDGKFGGVVKIGSEDMNVAGMIGANSEIKLHGYCDFGGPLKKS